MSTEPADPAPDEAWELAAAASLRPEPFGALAYHFGTRRLVFLKTRPLAAVVADLGGHADVRTALAAAGIGPADEPAYLAALGGLARSGIITRRALEVVS